ncbi:DUF4267 domain-containing protein [Nonomuraea sp. B10E15]|uniref:DUF4267 domain-containing protein n=1 Tax=unclassified Nonomuraea TaxID=2593643 RepID=UPI00325D32DF
MVATAYVIAALIGAGLIVISLRFLLVPESAAAGFGVPGTAAGAYFSVKAVRDLATALLIFVLLALGEPRTLGWAFLAMAVIPLGDAIIVARRGGHPALAYGMHGGTAAVTVAAALLLLLS